MGFIATWMAKKAAPYVIMAVMAVLLAGLWIWDANTISGLRSELKGANDSILAKDAEVKLAADDVARWVAQHKSDQALIDAANAEVEAGRADLAKSEEILRLMNEASAQQADELQAQLKKWKEKALANPTQVNRNGAVAVGAWCHVLRSPSGGVPAGCPAADGN